MEKVDVMGPGGQMLANDLLFARMPAPGEWVHWANGWVRVEVVGHLPSVQGTQPQMFIRVSALAALPG